MIWAIYRIHYGIDYIKQSINSIEDEVEKVFIFYSERPWFNTDKIKYKNQLVKFPSNPEDIKAFLYKNFNRSKFIIKKYECDTPFNQFGYLYDLSSKIANTEPKQVLFMEPDMIFGKNQLKILSYELKIKFWLNSIISRQIETWKYDNLRKNRNTYRIPMRKRRSGPVLWNINSSDSIKTEFSGAPQNGKKHFSNFIKILNMGFSINQKTMYYKHLLALAAFNKIKDSEPDETWYENKWLNWNENLTNLDISKGAQMSIKRAYKYKIPEKFYQYLIN